MKISLALLFVAIGVLLVIGGLYLPTLTQETVKFSGYAGANNLVYYIDTADFEFNLDESSSRISIIRDGSTAAFSYQAVDITELRLTDWGQTALPGANDRSIFPPSDCNYLEIKYIVRPGAKKLSDVLSALACRESFDDKTLKYIL